MNDFIIVRGGGDLATGIIQKLYRAGIRVLILEIQQPTCIRRNISLSEAVYENSVTVEDMVCQRIDDINDLDNVWNRGNIPLIIDKNGDTIYQLKPDGVVDATIAKRNLGGTNRKMAPITIAAGPGFHAGKDVDVVIETMRGHDLGRLITEGSAKPNTGIPGEIKGKGKERVIHAGAAGRIYHIRNIGDIVGKGEPLFKIDDLLMTAPFEGRLRGLIREGLIVPKGMKLADIDPRFNLDWNTISDKARCIGGGALEAYLWCKNRNR